MKKKFPYWATDLIKERIEIEGSGNEYEFTLNKDEDRLTDTFMRSGFLKDTLPTHTDLNTLLSLICYYLNRPEEFTQATLPSASDYKHRILYVSDLNCLAFSTGTNWKKINFDGDIN